MKKIFLVLSLVFIIGIVNVKAATESDLLQKLSQGYVIDGKTIKASDYQINEAKRYLNKYDISETDIDFIITKIDEIYNLAKDNKAKSFTKLSDANKSKIVSIIAEISNKTSVKVTLTKNGVLTIYESDGKTVFTEFKDADITKQTGSDNYIFVALSFVAVFGIIYIAKKAIKAND